MTRISWWASLRPSNAPWSCSSSQARVDLGLGRRLRRDEPSAVVGAEALVGVVGDDLGPARAPPRVDARVLGDLVDPRLEGDRPLGGAQAPQRRDEDVLGDVLGAPVVAEHPAGVGRDRALVALVEHLEGAVVAGADGRDERVVVAAGRARRGRLAGAAMVPHLPRMSVFDDHVACAEDHRLPRRPPRSPRVRGLRPQWTSGTRSQDYTHAGFRCLGEPRALRHARGTPARTSSSSTTGSSGRARRGRSTARRRRG